MRYHKAIEISRPEADFIIKESPRSDVVVLSHSDKWYDVRALPGKEVDDFVADLVRGHGEFAGRLRDASLGPNLGGARDVAHPAASTSPRITCNLAK